LYIHIYYYVYADSAPARWESSGMPRRNAKPIAPHEQSSLETLAINVRVMRQLRNITQEQLAEIAGMERTQISAMERALRSVQFATLDRLAKALNVEPWELLRPRDSTGR
jgi:DNA-binding Xre family transcriptional regulator